MFEQITEINDAVNASIKYEPEPPGQDIWQTPRETTELGRGDCEDIAIAKYFRLRAAGFGPELVYCLWQDPRTMRRLYHMVCLQGDLVLDNLDSEVKAVADRHDLHLIYAIGHKGMRNWGQDKLYPMEQNSKFNDLIERCKKGELDA
jgi:predicted transglutaminase-like cysteine proteinase